MGAQVGHAETDHERAAARGGRGAERDLTGIERLGVTAGNAAVSRLLGGLRPPRPPVQRVGKPGCSTCGDEEEAPNPLQRYASALGGSSRSALAPNGIAPTPVVQRDAPVALLDTDHVPSEPAQETDGSEAAPEVMDDEDAVAPGVTGGEAAPTAMEATPQAAVDETVGEQAAATSQENELEQAVPAAVGPALAGPGAAAVEGQAVLEEPAGEPGRPVTVDVDAAPARGPPETASNTADHAPTAEVGDAAEPATADAVPVPAMEANAGPLAIESSPPGPTEARDARAPRAQTENQRSGGETPDVGAPDAAAAIEVDARPAQPVSETGDAGPDQPVFETRDVSADQPAEVQRAACGGGCGCGPCQNEEPAEDAPALQRRPSPGRTGTAASAATAPGDGLDAHLDLLAGAALIGMPVEAAARQAGRAVAVQRISLNPLDWAKAIWGKIQSLGSSALSKARELGSAALGKAVQVGSSVASAVGSAISSALSTIANAARAGVTTLGNAAKSALQTLGSVARSGLSAVGGVARQALQGALRLGKGAWNAAAEAGRRALDGAMSAGKAVLAAGTMLAGKAWGAVKGKVGGLWNGLKVKAQAFKNKVMAGAKALLAKGAALGGKAVDAASGVAGKVGGSICSAISAATAWVYGKVAPLVKKAWAWAKANPAKAIALLLVPGGPLIALGLALQKKMLDLAKQLFAPVIKAISAKAKAAWNKAKDLGRKAWNTAKEWGGKAVRGATDLGRRALGKAKEFGSKVLGKAKDLGGKILGKAKEFGGKVLGKAKELGTKVWGKAKELGGKLLGIANSLTGGMAGKVAGMAQQMLGKAASVLSWVMSKARALADKALSAAKSLASKVLDRAKSMASSAWDRAKDLGSKVLSKAKDFAAKALATGKELLAKAGRAAMDFGKKALSTAKDLAGKALAKAKEWGAKAWATAKDWGAKAWAKAKELGGKAWDWTKKKASAAWDWAKGIGAKLAPYARKAWDWAKKIGKAIGIHKVFALVKKLGDKALDLAKDGLKLLKDKVLPIVEKVRQGATSAMSHSAAGLLCKSIGCAMKGFVPKTGKDGIAGLDLATDLIPVVSTVKDTCTCLTSENCVTNDKVSGVEQGMACAFAALDIAGYIGSVFTGGATTAGTVALRTLVKGGVKVGGKVIAKQALEQAMKKGGKALFEKLGREGVEELLQKLGKEGVGALAHKMGKAEFEAFAKEGLQQGVKGFDDLAAAAVKGTGKELGEKGAKEAGQELGEKGVKEGAEAAGEKGAKEGAEAAGDVAKKRTADGASEVKVKGDGGVELCPIQRCPKLKASLGSAMETPAVAKHADAAEAAAKEGKAAKAAEEGTKAAETAKKTGMPDWLKKRFEAGNKFDDEMAELMDKNYRQLLQADPSLARDPKKLEEALRQRVRHEVGVATDGVYGRLDTLLAKGPSGQPEIISRKFTQISEIKPQTAKGYIDELVRKYQPGSEIVNPAKGTPSRIPDSAIQVLQIPVQKAGAADPVMREFLEHATKKGVTVRDAAGKVLTPLP